MFAKIVGTVCLLSSVAVAAENLVPATPAKSQNYWCTWYAQNYWVGRGGDVKDLKKMTNEAARETINYHNIFNSKDGWAAKYLKHDRRDFWFLIDHGWQTKKKQERIAGGGAFFSLVADKNDFPQFAGMEPQEALRVFNEKIKSLGWRGLALWVRGNITQQQAETFVKWSKYAGIGYWKIDMGDTGNFNAYKAAQKFFPELALEYVTWASNLTPGWNKPGQKAYPSSYANPNKAKWTLSILKHDIIFRTYDATPLLMTSTTLRRTHDILKMTAGHPEYKAQLNVQDDCLAAAGLGVLVGSMRHPEYMQRTYKGKDLHQQLAGPRRMQFRINEVERFGRWARIAPAFPAGQGSYAASDRDLVDFCRFTEADTWNSKTWGKMVYQSAPAVMARNMPLPQVKIEGEPPFVCAATYPNGPVAVAAEGRVKPDKLWFEPRADVTIKVKDITAPIGIFGHYKSLTIEFPQGQSGIKRVLAQDLLADKSEDIADKVKIEPGRIIIPGELIDSVGTAAADKGDISAPGMVIKVIR